ncbi:phytanoyl-CoA dioxygenase family protein [Kineococcus indalonis]|uniref:hypothetical protein n=1 Tax=Kineococcus indalonis TaxID=2696566 RepID=UPI001413701D|nr:hypothetical protein [Kineococcus indalonis]NAZ87884.1 hypothetical protein [Kineococcus indalonis]
MKTSSGDGDQTGRSSRRWSRERTVVLPEAGRVVAELRREGIARTSVAALTGDAGVLDDVLACARALVERRAPAVAEQRRRVAAATGPAAPWDRPPDADRVPLLDADAPATPCRRLLQDPVLGCVAEAYCRRAVQHVGTEAWMEVAAASPAPPRRWQRGPGGRRPTVEVWVHLSDEEDGDGPLHYVRGSHLDRRGEGAPPGTFEALGGPAGTVVFADPRGMHRRSPAVGRDRLLLHGVFSSRRRAPRWSVPAPRAVHGAYALAGAGAGSEG